MSFESRALFEGLATNTLSDARQRSDERLNVFCTLCTKLDLAIIDFKLSLITFEHVTTDQWGRP